MINRIAAYFDRPPKPPSARSWLKCYKLFTFANPIGKGQFEVRVVLITRGG